ncbi:MAG: AsmA family protein [Alphaproteobacteria bacterium]|nr:AsmA family protein [Alphaproteobacteria bacterium]
MNAKLSGRPSITADLKANALDVDKMAGGAGQPAPAARGRPAAALPSTPIDTSPMRSFDASVKLVAASLAMSPLHMTNADLAVTLKDGVLTLSHLKGGLYGGMLDLSGTVDGSKPAVALDFKGDANGIYVGEMLRQTSGSNVFGSAIKVTIDGRLNVTGITLKGGGSSAEQIKASLGGGAQLGGHIFAGADKALTAIATTATGAVGGVIDNTLGSVLGVLGQGGVSPGNLLSAISLVLNRFVNHDSPVSGHINIAGGVLTDKNLVVQGDRATANVATRTNLANSTTDTTINFVLAEDPSAPYLVTTVRGPTSGPSFNVARGTARDPPGFVNTLTNTVTQPVKQVPKLLPNLPIHNPFGR